MKPSQIIIALVVVSVALLAFLAYERRSPVEKAGDSIRAAGRDLKEVVDPRTPGEKVRDGVKDTVRDIKN